MKEKVYVLCRKERRVILHGWDRNRYEACTLIRFVSISNKFGICTVVDLNGTIV